MKSYEERQDEWLESLGLDRESVIGKKFKVVRKAAPYEGGWGNCWTEGMDDISTIECEYICLGGRGVRNRSKYSFPFFVLEPAFKVGKKPPQPKHKLEIMVDGVSVDELEEKLERTTEERDKLTAEAKEIRKKLRWANGQIKKLGGVL